MTFRAASFNSTINSTSVTVNKPTGVVSGDTLVAFVGAEFRGTPACSGWTSVATTTPSGLLTILTKTAGSSEPSTYTFSGLTASSLYGVDVTVVAYYNVSAVLDAASCNDNGAGGGICSTNAMTATGGADLYIAAFADLHTQSGAPGWSAPSPLTARANNYNGTNKVAMLVADRTLTSAGSVPSYTVNVPTSDYTAAASILLITSSPPSAPTLISPSSGAALDASAGVPFTAQYNPTDGTDQSAYALRVKTSSGSYQYWNATSGALQSSIVWNTIDTVAGAEFTITLPAGILSNGNTYNWSFASQNSNGNKQGPFASDSTFTAQAGPTLVVNGPSGNVVTPKPTILWTTTPATGLSQTAYRVVVYTPAQYGAGGFAPGSSTGVWDSGTVAGSAQSLQVGTNLINTDTYRAYVIVTETGGVQSVWEYTQFTIVFDSPAAPTLTATAGSQLSPAGVPYPGGGTYPAGLEAYPANQLTLSGHDNLLPADDASFEASIGTWVSIANATLAQSGSWSVDGSESLSVKATAAGNVQAGPTSVPVTAGKQYTGWAVVRAAATARTVTLTLSWLNSGGTQISASTATATDSTSANTTLSVTATAPAGTVTVRVILQVTSPAANEIHYADEVGVFPGTVTAWTRGGLAGQAYGYVTYPDTDGTPIPVRGTDNGVLLPAPDQSVQLVDAEVIPGASRTYSAWVEANV